MKVQANGISFNVEIDGNENKPVVMLSHSLAASVEMWDPQMGELTSRYRVVRYDMRGHGATDVTDGPYTMEGLADDAIALMDALGLEKVMFVGLSIGGMIGQTIALDHPDRLQALVLCSSTSSLRHGDPAVWDARINAVKSDGMGVEVDATISRWFVPKFVAEHDEAVEQVRHMIRETPVAGYVGCCEAILPFHLTDRLGEIDLPVLVMPGEQDVALPAELSQTIHDTIRGSSLQIIPNASHFANVEQPEIFNVNLMEFLNGIQ